MAALAVLATRLGFDTDVEAQSLQMSFAELPRLAKTLPVILRAKNGGALILEDARADPMKGSVAIIRDPNDPDDEQQPFGLAWLMGQVLRKRKLFVDIGAGARGCL